MLRWLPIAALAVGVVASCKDKATRGPAATAPEAPADPSLTQRIDGALRACAAAPDKPAALQAALGSPAAGRPDALLRAMQSPHRPLGERRCAALGLRLWPDATTREGLSAMALAGTDDDLAGDAAEALAATGDPQVVQTLIAVAGREAFKLRRRAIRALRDLGRHAGSREACRVALTALATQGGPRIVESSLQGLTALGGPSDVPAFRAHLKHPDMLARQRATEGLAKHGGPDAVEALGHALSDSFQPVAVAGAQGLGRLQSAAGVAPLGAYLDGDGRAAADAAMRALGAIGHPDGVRHVTPYLFDRDGYLRVSAAQALGVLGDPSALPHLERALDTELINARTAVLDALAEFGRRASRLRPRVVRLTREADLHPMVAAAAARALTSMGPPPDAR